MKKTIIFLLAAAVMVCMAGCSSSDNAETMPVTERSAATEKVTESITETESETVYQWRNRGRMPVSGKHSLL